MKVTGVPNCCGALYVMSDEQFKQFKGSTTGYSPVEAVPPSTADAVLLSGIPAPYTGLVNATQAEKDAKQAELIADELLKTESAIHQDQFGGYPTLMLAIGTKSPYHVSQEEAFKRAGWVPCLRWPQAHNAHELVLYAKPRTNTYNKGGKLNLVSPENPLGLEVTLQAAPAAVAQDTGLEWKAAAMAVVPTEAWTPGKLTTFLKEKIADAVKANARSDELQDEVDAARAEIENLHKQVRDMQAAEADRLAKLNEKRERKGLKPFVPRKAYRQDG